MGKRLHSLQQSNPELADKPEVKEAAADVDLYRALDAVNSSEGGRIIKEAMLKDIHSSFDWIIAHYKSSTHLELCAYVAQLEGRVNLLQALNRARKQADLANDFLETYTA